MQLPPRPPATRIWRGSTVAPFAGNNMLVLYSCPANSSDKYFVRVLHNEEPIAMPVSALIVSLVVLYHFLFLAHVSTSIKIPFLCDWCIKCLKLNLISASATRTTFIDHLIPMVNCGFSSHSFLLFTPHAVLLACSYYSSYESFVFCWIGLWRFRFLLLWRLQGTITISIYIRVINQAFIGKYDRMYKAHVNQVHKKEPQH